MKVLFTLLLALIFTSINAQVHIAKDVNGNFIQAVSKDTANQFVNKGIDTGKKFVDSKGESHSVYQSTRGSLYIIKTSKNGKQYKQYLKE